MRVSVFDTNINDYVILELPSKFTGCTMLKEMISDIESDEVPTKRKNYL